MNKLNFIEDKEIENLDVEGNDLLETKKYAQNIEQIIKKAKTPFTIGLFGEWGSGKSSIINTVRKKLENDKQEKIKFVIYNAWKYTNDSFRRMLLKTLQEKLKLNGTDHFNTFYANEIRDTKINSKFNGQYFMYISISFIVILFIIPNIYDSHINKESNSLTLHTLIYATTTFFAIVIAFFKNAFSDYKVTITKEKMFAPEQFEEVFDEMMSKSLKRYKLFSLAKSWITGNSYKKNIDKLVIVIDNIDRCDKENAYNLLTDIKSFLEREHILFLIPVDDQALRGHFENKYQENDKGSDEFLRKIFNITVKIQPLQPIDLFTFTDRLNTSYNLNLNPTTIDIVAKNYATNPRRIIQLLNNLMAELNRINQKYGEQFSKDYENLIAKLLIIQEEWKEVYKIIIKNPQLFKEKTFGDCPKDFIDFDQRTKAISIGVDVSVIEKITTNIQNESRVSQETLNILNDLNKKENEEAINRIRELPEDEYKGSLLYLIEELFKELDRQTYKSGALNRFKQLLIINTVKTIPVYINNNFISQLKLEIKNTGLDKVINKLNDDEEFEIFFKFVATYQEQDLYYYEEFVVDQFKNAWTDNNKDKSEKKPEIWINSLEYYINNCNIDHYINELQHIFVRYYNHYEEWYLYDDGTTTINEDKLDKLIKKEFINNLISKFDPLSNNELSNNILKEITYLSKHISLHISDIKDIFKPIANENNNRFSDLKGWQDHQIETIKKLNALLENIKPVNEESQEVITYIKFLNNGNITLNNNNRISCNMSDLSDESRKELLEFYLEIYRVTDNAKNYIGFIENLINQGNDDLKSYFWGKLIQLRDKNKLTLQPFFNLLINMENYNDKNFLDLCRDLFIQEKIDENTIKNKLKNILDAYIDKKSEEVDDFLKKLFSHKKTKEIITELLQEDFNEHITDLPEFLQVLFYDRIYDDIVSKTFEGIKQTINDDKGLITIISNMLKVDNDKYEDGNY